MPITTHDLGALAAGQKDGGEDAAVCAVNRETSNRGQRTRLLTTNLYLRQRQRQVPVTPFVEKRGFVQQAVDDDGYEAA